MVTLMLSEILKKIDEAKTREEKLNLLRQYASPQLKSIFWNALNPNVEFFTNQIPEWTADAAPIGNNPTNLYKSVRTFHYLRVDKSPDVPNVDDNTRMGVMMNQLINMALPEGRLYASVILKRLDIDGVDVELINEAFPGLIPDKVVVVENRGKVVEVAPIRNTVIYDEDEDEEPETVIEQPKRKRGRPKKNADSKKQSSKKKKEGAGEGSDSGVEQNGSDSVSDEEAD